MANGVTAADVSYFANANPGGLALYEAQDGAYALLAAFGLTPDSLHEEAPTIQVLTASASRHTSGGANVSDASGLQAQQDMLRQWQMQQQHTTQMGMRQALQYPPAPYLVDGSLGRGGHEPPGYDYASTAQVSHGAHSMTHSQHDIACTWPAFRLAAAMIA